jgi:hypothetical protein
VLVVTSLSMDCAVCFSKQLVKQHSMVVRHRTNLLGMLFSNRFIVLVVSNAVFSADNIPLQPVLNAFAIFRLFGFIHSSRSFGENFNILMRSTCEKGHPPLGREFD